MTYVALAGTKSAGDLSRCDTGAIFVDSMPENFGQYITTEIMAQNVKLSVTTEPAKALCVMRGTVVLGGFRNAGSASIQVVGPSREVVWSATSGDKDSVKDLAHNLVKQMKHDLQNPGKPR
ncbi:MAG TPA: hypothetical protein VH350_15065 [Candidatus Sulfotelmatobacter sp.]|nr:hypothetical protein [Candidatus Sulfotelmatobacter sp.]